MFAKYEERTLKQNWNAFEFYFSVWKLSLNFSWQFSFCNLLKGGKMIFRIWIADQLRQWRLRVMTVNQLKAHLYWDFAISQMFERIIFHGKQSKRERKMKKKITNKSFAEFTAASLLRSIHFHWPRKISISISRLCSFVECHENGIFNWEITIASCRNSMGVSRCCLWIFLWFRVKFFLTVSLPRIKDTRDERSFQELWVINHPISHRRLRHQFYFCLASIAFN